jgi:hypothetical protein
MGAAAAQPALEYAVKATYLYKFGPFVEWPAEALATPDSPFTLCIAGHDPFGMVLDQAVIGQQVNGHPIAIRRMGVVTANSGCQVLFLGGSPEQSIGAGLIAVRGSPVLTVTDAQGLIAPHGIIDFVIVENHVRFSIDDAAAAANGLAISSQLLSLAQSVRPRN